MVIINPKPQTKRKTRRKCPTCQKRATMTSWFYEWYGWYTTCLNCGEQWQDGQRAERPFMRGWRKINIRKAKERWRNEKNH